MAGASVDDVFVIVLFTSGFRKSDYPVKHVFFAGCPGEKG